MLQTWLQRTPNWVWLSCLPVLGGLAIAYAGYKSKTNSWMVLGVSLTGLAFLLSSTHIVAIVWLGQVVTAFVLKKRFLIKTYPQELPLPEDWETAKSIAKHRRKIDINSCSKHELVHSLGLPIVYANDLESLRTEGYIFTHIEELNEIVGIPEAYIKKIAPLISFRYDYKQEAMFSWKRLNILSAQELIECGLEREVAEQIVRERQRRGEYKSLMEVKRRTGLPFYCYRQLA